MEADLQLLIITTITVSCLHTIAGPDHYLPFIALSKSKGWTIGRTIFWTIVCGCGHIWSSVLLGLGGVAIGWSVSKVSWLEGVRGGIAAWALFIFGLVYAGWGLMRARQNKMHKHFDVYENGSVFVYEHKEGDIVSPKERYTVTPWVMFLIFILGPCEPMIPLLYFPAVKNSFFGITLLITVYTIFTLAVMLLMVVLGYYGFSMFKGNKAEKYVHVLGGLSILTCGAGMLFFGW